jgi:lipopolysaccharide biosynthesis protein
MSYNNYSASRKKKIFLEIQNTLPHAELFVTENSGKDVRPFLLLLEQGRFDKYDYVCKIHGKKSTDGGRNVILGDIWRNRMIFDLIAAPGAIEAIVTRFKQHGDVGMIGPTAYRYPSSLCNLERSWGENEARILEIASRLGFGESDYVLDFFCGTMFWVRPEALKPLGDLRLSELFARKNGAIDGQLEHAVERLFATSVRCAGYRVEGITGADLTFSDTHL